jgi:hypothetical protein
LCPARSGSALSADALRDARWMLRVVLVFILVAVPAPVHDAHWSWPVHGSHRIVRPFIAPATPYSAGHRGIDIAASGNVYAPADGIVHFSGFVVSRDVLSITHANGVISSYEPVLSPLHVGDPVTRGEVIGTIEPGHCASLCLHFGVRVDGQYVSPLLFLGGIQHSVLLPTVFLGAAAPAALCAPGRQSCDATAPWIACSASPIGARFIPRIPQARGCAFL